MPRARNLVLGTVAVSLFLGGIPTGSRSDALDEVPEIRQLRAILETTADRDSVRWLLALAYRDTGTLEGRTRALDLFRQVRPRYYDDYRYHRELALLYLEGQRYDDARESMKKAIKQAPSEVHGRGDLAEMLFRHLLRTGEPDDLKELLRFLDETLALDPADRTALLYKSFTLSMARILDLARGAETSAMARACAVAILRANPDDRSALLLAGVHSLDLGEPETATALFERGLALADPADRGVFLMPVWCAPDSILRQLATAPPGQLDSLNAAYWDSRDPTPLTPANENRLEYWKRLVLADLFFGDPEKRLRGWETPRGELLVRYGPPEALTFSKAAFEEGEAMQQGDAGLARRRTKSLKEATKPSTISMLHPTQTWAYSFGGRPVEFSFVDPTLHDRFIPENPSEFDALVKQAPAVLADGDHGSLRNCYVGSSGTRADGGRTRQAIVVGLPAGAAGDPWAGAEVAFRVLDPGGRVVTSELRTIAPGSATSLAAGSRANLVLTETPLAAGRYTTEVRITAGTREGTFAVPADVRDFGRDSLEVSDLQLGFPPAGEGAGGAASMIRNPTRLVPRGNPVVIAFEVYNLQPGSGEVARYRVRYTLLPIAYAREYARLLASGNAASDPALQFGQLGRALGGVTLDERNYSDVLFPQVDVPLAPAARVRLAFRLETAGLRDGDYALVVTTTDLVANRAVSVRSPFTLLPEAGFRSALAAD